MVSRGRCRSMGSLRHGYSGVIAWPIRKRRKRWRGRYGVGGQLSPVVACVREEQLELIDGFKRFAAAAARLRVDDFLSVRVLEVD